MDISPFEHFILKNLYHLWKEYGTQQAKTFEALIEEFDYKEKNIRKPLKRLISAGLVDSDSFSAWITKEGIRQMDFLSQSDKSAVGRSSGTPVSIEINFLKNFEKAICKSELLDFEKEMWVNGIKQISQNPLLIKALKTALNVTTDTKPS